MENNTGRYNIGDVICVRKLTKDMPTYVEYQNQYTGTQGTILRIDSSQDLKHTCYKISNDDGNWWYSHPMLELVSRKAQEPSKKLSSIDNATTQKEILHNYLLDKHAGESYQKYNYQTITQLEEILEDNVKPVHEHLQHFIGEYEITKTNIMWIEQFKKEFYNNITNFYRKRKCKLDKEKEDEHIITLRDSIWELTIENGYFIINNKQEKVLKYLKKQIKKIYEITDQEFEQLQFVQTFNNNQNNKQQLYLVITNSILSTLGMSAYAPTSTTSERNKIWKSCMAPNKKYVPASLLVNLLDQNSLICYVTDKKQTTFIGEDNNEQLIHDQMYQRQILRLGLDADQIPYVILDRAYPHNSFSIEIAQIIKTIADKHDIKFSIFASGNETQESTHYISNCSLYKTLRICKTPYIQVTTPCSIQRIMNTSNYNDNSSNTTNEEKDSYKLILNIEPLHNLRDVLTIGKKKEESVDV